MEGEVYLERDFGADTFLGVEFINSTTLLMGKSAGAALWNIESDEYVQMSFYGHHDYEYNKANNTYFTLNVYFLEHEGTTYGFDRIKEYTPDGELVWELNTSDFISFYFEFYWFYISWKSLLINQAFLSCYYLFCRLFSKNSLGKRRACL